MKFLTLIFSMSVLLWTCLALSKEISYNDLDQIVKTQNDEVKAFDNKVDAKKVLTGFFARSFIPKLELTAGQENFESEPLGSQSSEFYGIEAQLNLFRGMTDYWEGESRNLGLKQTELEKVRSTKEILYLAQKSFLKVAKIKLLLKSYQEGLKKLNTVKTKASKKASAGVIARSDLTSINLIRIGFENDIEGLNRVLNTELASLSLILNRDQLLSTHIKESSIEENLTPLSLPKGAHSLISIHRGNLAEVKTSQAKSIRGTRLPKVDLFAKFGREPFSEREYTNGSDRDEWQAGVKLSWNVGDYFEKSNEARSLESEALYDKKMSDYYARLFKRKVSSQIRNLDSLIQTVKNISREIKLSRNYYSQISSEYLRGVKSTSDLTTAFDQIISLNERRLDLIIEYHLLKADILLSMYGPLPSSP